MKTKKNKYNFLLKAFGKMFDEKETKEELELILIEKLMKDEKITDNERKDFKAFMNDVSVYAIIPKKEEIQKLLTYNFDIQEKDYNLAEMYDKFPKDDNKERVEIKSRFSVELLKHGFNLMDKKFYEAVTIKLNKNAPIWMETDDFIFLLAPRVEIED